MRNKPPPILEAGRLLTGPMGSDASFAMNGAFQIKAPMSGALLAVIVSDGLDPVDGGWEHVSVSLKNRTPRWDEMSYVKRLCWEPHECVVQFHPPEID